MLIKKRPEYPEPSPPQGGGGDAFSWEEGRPANNNNTDEWPLFDETSSVYSFSSAPSFSDSEDDDYMEKKFPKVNKTNKSVLKHQTSPQKDDANTIAIPTAPPKNVPVPTATTSSSSSRTTHPDDHGTNDPPAASASAAGPPPVNDNNDASRITGEILEIGTLAVIGIVGFLVTFAIGTVIGEGRSKSADRDCSCPSSYDWGGRAPSCCNNRGEGSRGGYYSGRRTLSRW